MSRKSIKQRSPERNNASVYRDARGNVLGVFAAARDVTAQKQTSQYARSLIEASLDPLVTISADGKITDVNEATVKVTGLPREKLIGTDFSNYFTEPEHARAGYREVFEKGTVTDYPLTVRHESGKLTDVLYNASVYRDSGGNVLGVFAAARDITERKRSERAHAYLAAIVESSDDAILSKRLDGTIVSWNPGAEKVYGYRAEEVVGRSISILIPPDLPDELRAILERISRVEHIEHYETVRVRKDGQRINVAVTISPITDREGRIIGASAISRDISQRKRAEEEIRRLNETLEARVAERTAQLEASNKELEAFTYSVSHDLRAPLRHVDGFSKLLYEEYRGELPAEAQEYVSTIRDSVLQMGGLIDDLLNLARMGRKTLSVEVTGLNILAQEVIEDLKRANPNRAIEWKVQTLPFVECDPALMKQVFANLLSNAVKFTRPRDPAVIEVGVTHQDGCPVVFVRDNGVGFSMKYADKLFGVFQRLHRAEDFEGTGVGLATVQRIIHKHGGRIWADGELDKGATFNFTLGTVVGLRPGNQTH